MPKIEALCQNSIEWRDWRLGGLGSSDAPVVMGDSRWMVPRTLWQIKTRRTEEPDRENIAMRRGRQLENAARAAYERETGEVVEPHCMNHDRLPWMRASLDGLNFDRTIAVEVKCPLRRGDHEAALSGQVPRHYYAQLQHQLEVSGAHELHYWSFDGRHGALVRVVPDLGYIEDLVRAEGEFWRRVIENRWPGPRLKEQDLGGDPQWSDSARAYRKVRLRLDDLSDQERALRASLLSMTDARRAFGSGIELLRTSRKGAVNYSAIPELLGVDLERYRKPEVEVVKISLLDGAD
jgi:putative phage-type endonuclease